MAPRREALRHRLQSAAAICSVVILSQHTAIAYPFQPNGTAFAAWANQLSYSDGFKNKRRFYNFSDCRFWRSKRGQEIYELAQCSGFYTETTRLGVSKRCVSDHIVYQRRISPTPADIVLSTEYSRGAPQAECVAN